MSGDFDLKHVEGDDVGGEAREGLTATPTHTHQQHVTTRLTNNTNDSRH